jgi:hypothetical protein
MSNFVVCCHPACLSVWWFGYLSRPALPRFLTLAVAVLAATLPSSNHTIHREGHCCSNRPKAIPSLKPFHPSSHPAPRISCRVEEGKVTYMQFMEDTFGMAATFEKAGVKEYEVNEEREFEIGVD